MGLERCETVWSLSSSILNKKNPTLVREDRVGLITGIKLVLKKQGL